MANKQDVKNAFWEGFCTALRIQDHHRSTTLEAISEFVEPEELEDFICNNEHHDDLLFLFE